jgi:hypothetical protein
MGRGLTSCDKKRLESWAIDTTRRGNGAEGTGKIGRVKLSFSRIPLLIITLCRLCFLIKPDHIALDF